MPHNNQNKADPKSGTLNSVTHRVSFLLSGQRHQAGGLLWALGTIKYMMNNKAIKLNAYGRRIYIERVNDEWISFYQSIEGKRRRANDLIIPADLDRDEVVTWIADLLHESATERNPRVEVLD
jgi:hypothetical protein